MRLYDVVLAAATILLTAIDGISIATDANRNPVDLSATTRSFTQEQQNIPTKRSLRVYTTEAEDNDEERAINFKSLPGVDKLKTAWTQNKLSKYLKKGKTGDEVFSKLKLDKAGDTLFENPKFHVWVKYVTDYNIKAGKNEISIIPTLTKHYADDVLVKMLEIASKSSVVDTRRVASSLQEQQVKYWRSLDLLPTDVFTRLRLGDKGKLDDMLTNPSFFALNKYLVDYNVRYSKSLTMVEVLKGGYGDEAIARMLQQTATKAKDVETQKMAVRLQNQQFEHWRDIGLNSDDIFKELRLNKAGVTLENSNFVVWGKFLQNWSGENTTPFKSLWARYGEKNLATMLVAPREQAGDSVIPFLQNQLVNQWLAMERTPADVFKMIGSSDGGKKLVGAYRWSYKNKFNAA
ncbi:hypothetical protein F442_15866 [Phytophthora nicotianae P10297]|uniref:RxLR effector protein n=1 Tax=Phytophthora nicotianae P10297 TaxID=1317064 RepID=W2YMQ2_PHYNI|nr:hypothetical protein F442_15866 [Phytophthora nicotianae P10297]